MAERRERGISALVGVVAVSALLLTRSWEVPYLIVAAAATVSALGLTPSVRRRMSAWGLVLMAVATSAVMVNGWRQARRLNEVRPDTAGELARLSALASAVIPELQGSAMRIVAATIGEGPGERHRVVEALMPRSILGEGAGVLLERGVPIAWAGAVRVAPDSLSGDVGVVETPFYIVAWARATRGDRAAIALRTLGAVPPATTLASTFAEAAARVSGLAGVEVTTRPNGGVPVTWGGRSLAWLRPLRAEPELVAARRDARARAQVLVAAGALLLALLLAGGVRRSAMALACGLMAVAVVPLNTLSNLAPVFSAATYFSPIAGPWTASAGALALSGALGTVGALLVVRQHRWRPGRLLAGAGALVGVVSAPLLTGLLVRGVSLPERGAAAAQWFAWALALFLAILPVVVLTSWLGSRASGRAGARGLAWTATAAAAALAAASPVVWRVESGMPWPWFAGWWVALAMLAISRWRRTMVVHAGVLTACGTLALAWATVARQRVELAERDVALLTVPEAETQPLLERLYQSALRNPPSGRRADLLKLYVGSDLAASGNPAELALWDNAGATESPAAELIVAQLQRRAEGEGALVRAALERGTPVLRDVTSRQGTQLILAAPLGEGRVLSAVVAPRNQLVGDDPFASLLGLEVPSVGEPPYRLTLSPSSGRDVPSSARWVRRNDEWHGDWRMDGLGAGLTAHVEVELRPLDALLARAFLLGLSSLLLLGVLWLLVGVGDPAFRRWAARRLARWRHSYRARLTLALFGAFVLPSLAFGIWTLDRLSAEDLTSRSLLVQETLRAVRLSGPNALAAESERLQAPLFWYDGGRLTATADELHLDLAPLGRLIDPVAGDEVVFGRETIASRRLTVGGVPTLVGYRALGGGAVLAAPARRSELTLERQRGDVMALLLVALALGAGIAWGLSGLAAVAFAQPIGALRRAADHVAHGARDLPMLSRPPASEFAPVFARFQSMAVDLGASRDALDAARRRTEAVLRDVASGVIAFDARGHVVLANPQAEAIVGHQVVVGALLPQSDSESIGLRVADFIAAASDDDAFELSVRGRDVRARLTRLSRGDGGAVLTLDDVTELARAQRIFAWAEMARQVAHEIKNPLTPIRLGVQHLRRAHADQRPDFGEILDRNVARVLAEIDRLDEIARSFSKFGVRPGEAETERVDLAAVVHDVVALEQMAEGDVSWDVHVAAGTRVRARDGELREVLLNLLENARLAHATRISVHAGEVGGRVALVIADDGDGVSDEVLLRAFEPRFSTRTSGSGLGLAIARRLVESWGGRIDLGRRVPRGVEVTLVLDPGV